MKALLTILSLTVALFAVPATAGAATPVTSLTAPWGATNPSVVKTQDGVSAGVYADGGRAGGSLFYSGANGLTLAQIAELGFTESHNTSDDSPIAAPYLRIFLDGDTHDVIFDATQCATVIPPENTLNTFEVTTGDVRYDDDTCDGVPPDQQPWAAVVAAHGSEVVSGIYVTTGFTGGLDLSSLVTSLSVNGQTFCFNCDPAPANGAPGAVGTTTIVNRVVTAPGALPVAQAASCRGDEPRALRAPRRRGERFLSTRAIVTIAQRVVRLKARGRRISVDLPAVAANYNVHITSRYRTKQGRTRTVRTTRNLSVVCE